MFTAEIINYSNVTQNVYVVIDLEYLEVKPDLTSTWHVLAVGTCDGKGMSIRPEEGKKKFALTSQPMTAQKNGHLFGIREYCTFI
jgi:hypothetical protein